MLEPSCILKPENNHRNTVHGGFRLQFLTVAHDKASEVHGRLKIFKQELFRRARMSSIDQVVTAHGRCAPRIAGGLKSRVIHLKERARIGDLRVDSVSVGFLVVQTCRLEI